MVRMSAEKIEFIIEQCMAMIAGIMMAYVGFVLGDKGCAYFWGGFFFFLASLYGTVRTLYYWVEDKPVSLMTREQKIAFLIKIQQQ